MAVTKTHPIKSTLKAAIEYICDPEKTDGRLLISSFGCTAETADIEFAWTRRHAIDKGTHLGRHLIQAFEPGEITPEEAHRIGMELAREVLGGKYEFVLTTHIDKDHVHNHLIFNAVSFADHRKYHSNKRSYHYIRRVSDRLCREHGLSVIVPGPDKGKSYIEHTAAQSGSSYKAKLKAAIDRLIPACRDMEELLARLQREGYEIKRGKYISCRYKGVPAKSNDFVGRGGATERAYVLPNGETEHSEVRDDEEQERFTRLKTLGIDYTEDAIRARIAGGSRPSKRPKERSGRVGLLIDIQNSIKAQQSAGYAHWAKLNNLKEAARTMNFLTEHGIDSYEELTEKVAAITEKMRAAHDGIKDVEQRAADLLQVKKYAENYRRLKPVYDRYRASRDKEKFLRGNESEIILFEAAARELKRLGAVPIPTTERIDGELAKLGEKKAQYAAEYAALRRQAKEYETMQKNVDMLLSAPEQSAEKRREQELE